ncbi:MAG: stage II sporulation protein M [Firmicutes bacterium]|nr:stage II sporulation protein M [Bacillota bacterium]
MYHRGQLMGFLQDYLRENLGLYLFVILLFTIGVTFGALAIKTLDGEQKAELFSHLELFIQGIDLTIVSESNLPLQQSLQGNIKTMGLIWLLGLLVLGLPLVLLMLFTKGFALGFTVGFLVQELGYKGIIFSVASVLPPNILLIPALIMMCVAAISFSLLIIRSRLALRKRGLYRQVLAFSSTAVLAIAMGLIASLIEVFVCPVFINLASGLFFQ